MIGEKIQKIRKSKGLTLSECAERANISKSYLSNIERNLNQNPSIQIIEKIAAVLGVEVNTLIKRESLLEQTPETEWLEFVKDLKKSGIKTHELQEYKTVIEFAKWQKEKSTTKQEVKKKNGKC
ncbi:helix-turn-helix domain-containing protein [Oceanobacillus halophilus]|uniref:XRE family transcriptional regulator n=1 Tax=Oceanobacillus halophilus TaxID=930130 RepID=A0A495A2A0_9BACI|nr:helix-turn-helix transcriptional regulator [Oceanobacillus halophilus]RKQ33496.1 XRE family transcriptional regulator [Oceanobacillus halophilus]